MFEELSVVLNARLLKADRVFTGEVLSVDRSDARGLRPGVELYQVNNQESGSNLNRGDAISVLKRTICWQCECWFAKERVGGRNCKQRSLWPHLPESSDGWLIY